ncbi:hypothetical protein VZT92_005657 [Zoarces viviparus]|uniref:Uncharacterized protein n=1 Tax=Zoarces viviparus TaxID=48416 RepID=A0AAW1FT56_ZOAVI
MRISRSPDPHKFRAEPLLLRSHMDTQISSLLRGTNIRSAYLDGLRGLAFDLMRYGGGLVHLETPTQTVLLIQVRRSSRRDRAPSTSLQRGTEGRCSRSLLGARLKKPATASDSCRMCASRSAAR